MGGVNVNENVNVNVYVNVNELRLGFPNTESSAGAEGGN
jgi:hypothetical protein